MFSNYSCTFVEFYSNLMQGFVMSEWYNCIECNKKETFIVKILTDYKVFKLTLKLLTFSIMLFAASV